MKSDKTLMKEWTDHQQAVNELKAQKAEWQGEIDRLTENGCADEAELDRMQVLQNKLDSFPVRVRALSRKGQLIQAQLKHAAEERRGKIQPVALTAAHKKLADAMTVLRPLCGSDSLAEELALQTPAVMRAFELCRMTPTTTTSECLTELKTLAGIELELAAEERGETIPTPEPSFERLQKELNATSVKEGLAVTAAYEKRLESMRTQAKADLETWERHFFGKRLDYTTEPVTRI